LFYREGEFLILVAGLASGAVAGETGDEDQRIISNRMPDPPAPVFSWPQVGGIAPNGHSRRFEVPLQHVDSTGVLAHV
jgi:hypothetical protein